MAIFSSCQVGQQGFHFIPFLQGYQMVGFKKVQGLEVELSSSAIIHIPRGIQD